MAESSNNPVEALIGLIQGQLLDVNTCIPAQIVSYENGVARVLPTGKKRFADGDSLEYPIIPNVRVCWPSFIGGNAGMKGPVRDGDNCLLIFSQQAVDGSDDRRMFDLQDAYAVMCDLGKATESDSTNNDDLTMYFGDAHIRLTETGKLIINAPDGVIIDTTSIQTNASEGVTQTGGVLSSNGIVLDTHVHEGVTVGIANTGQPV